MIQSFSKIWIIGILAVVVAGGFFSWQKFVAQKEEVKSIEIIQNETTQKETEYIENNYLQVILKSVTDYSRADKNNVRAVSMG